MFWKNKKQDGELQSSPESAVPTASSTPGAPNPGASSLTTAEQSSATAPQSTQQSDASAARAAPSSEPTVPSPDQPGSGQKVSEAASVFGEIVGLLLRTPKYRDYKIADLEWLVLPALRNNQFALARTKHAETGQSMTVGVALWAMVDQETDKSLVASQDTPIRLPPDKWRSGDIVWLVDAVGPQEAIQGTLARLVNKEFAGREVRMAAVDAAGKRTVRNLKAA